MPSMGILETNYGFHCSPHVVVGCSLFGNLSQVHDEFLNWRQATRR